MSYALDLTLRRPFEAVVADVRTALAEQGFGIVSEIDLQQTLRNKLDVEIAPQLILGACNPTFAHRALQLEPSIGVLLPCNVVVRSAGDDTIVEMLDPHTMVDMTGNAAIDELAGQVSDRLRAALDQLSDRSGD